MENSSIDYSSLTRDDIKDICMVQSRNCVSVGRLLLLLGGSRSHYEFLSDVVVAHSVYEAAKKDIIDLGLFHDVYFYKEVDLGNIQAVCEVVYYKKSKLQRPRLVMAACYQSRIFWKKRQDRQLLYIHLDLPSPV